MSTPRYDAGVCAKDGVIYVCGGFDGNRFLRSVEALVSRLTHIFSLQDCTLLVHQELVYEYKVVGSVRS